MKVTSLSEFSTEKVSFSDVEKVSFNSNDFERININVEYSDGEVGSLILETDNCFSFGLQSDKEKFENGSGYTLPIVMFRRSPSGELHPTEHQAKFMDTFNKIVEKCISHLRSLGREFTENISKCMFLKESSSPMLYTKLRYGVRDDEILTPFYELCSGEEDNDDEIDPMKFLNKKCQVRAAVRFHSIYIGKTVSLQVKLVEVNVRSTKKQKRQRLLRR